MKAVILGAGIVGTQVAKRLIEERKDVVLIEKNPDTARIAANSLDCLVMNEDGSLLDVLKSAGAQDADYFIALTGSDEVNMVTCGIVAAEFPKTKRIARVRNPYFSRIDLSKRAFMGIDFIVNPDVEAARTILRSIDQGVVGDVVHFHEHNLQLRAHHVTEGFAFVGKSVRDIRSKIRREFLITSIFRAGDVLIPSGDTEILAGDTVYFLGSPEVLDGILGKSGDFGRDLRKVVIVGGGRIGRHIARELTLDQRNSEPGFMRRLLRAFAHGGRKTMVFIDSSIEKCKALSQEFPEALVVNRDIAEEGTFLEENLDGTDLFVAVTANQELNLLAAMNAKHHGVKKSLALVMNTTYLKLTSKILVDGVLSLKTNVANSVINILRGGSLKTVYAFYDTGVKILEFTVLGTSSLVGRRIHDLSMPKGSLVIFLVRAEKSLIPTGDTNLKEGDHLGIFTGIDVLPKVESLFLETL